MKISGTVTLNFEYETPSGPEHVVIEADAGAMTDRHRRERRRENVIITSAAQALAMVAAQLQQEELENEIRGTRAPRGPQIVPDISWTCEFCNQKSGDVDRCQNLECGKPRPPQ